MEPQVLDERDQKVGIKDCIEQYIYDHIYENLWHKENAGNLRKIRGY